MPEGYDLDALLYAWLSEPDERRAESRFAAYYRTAFPRLCRLAHTWRVDIGQAEDLAQKSLIKFFKHLGTERRVADAHIRRSLAELRPLDWGALHVRLVQGWVTRVRVFREAAVGFRLPAVSGTQDRGPDRDEINGRIEPLRYQALHLLHQVQQRMSPKLPFLEVRATTDATSVATFSADTNDQLDADSVADFVTQLLSWPAKDQDGPAYEVATGCVGGIQFAEHSSTIYKKLPTLSIPSNGLLYTIAKRQFLDELRKRRPESLEYLEDKAHGSISGVLDELDLDSGGPVDGATESGSQPGMETLEPDSDDSDLELDTRYSAFLEHLRAPLTRAEDSWAAAVVKGGSGKAEHTRVVSLQRKFERLYAVLAALREDPQPTEDEIARRHGLTRNQVKYVIERIREEFNDFFPNLAREAAGRRKSQGSED